MKLQTNIPLQPQRFNQVDYNSNVLLFGSCFSEKIGHKFHYFKFKSTVNPFGILFHPLAVEHLITRAINRDFYNEDELIFHNEQWRCLDAHSKLNLDSKSGLLNSLNEQIESTHQRIKEASHIIITLGTSWVYRHIVTNKIVANCHKLPQKQFLKELLSVEQIVESLESIMTLIESFTPMANFIFTVSPVRHLKDGFIENTRSKSHLIAAIHSVLSHRTQPRCHYFPSYEIVIDELRDYRFYKTDMLHPNDLAVDYIWEKFKDVWISKDINNTMQKVDVIQKGLKHRSFNIKSKAHQKFTAQLQSQINHLCAKYPHINFD